MFGDSAQVETALWVCMSIWAAEHPLSEDALSEAMRTIRGRVPALRDRAGLSFHDLGTSRLDYTPVIRYMREVFALLQEQVL